MYQAATSLERRQVHRVLADAVGEDDPDRATGTVPQPWTGPTPTSPRPCTEVAVRAEQRGGHAAAADAFERSAALTVDESARAVRLLGRRDGLGDRTSGTRSGAGDTARELAEDPLLRADIDRLRARIEIYVGSAADAHRIFTVAARTVADLDPRPRAGDGVGSRPDTHLRRRQLRGLPGDVLAQLLTATRPTHPAPVPAAPAGHPDRATRGVTGPVRPPLSSRPWTPDVPSRTWT